MFENYYFSCALISHDSEMLDLFTIGSSLVLFKEASFLIFVIDKIWWAIIREFLNMNINMI